MSGLDLWDYVSMSVIVSLTCLVGIYHVFKSRKMKKTEDFLVSNRSLNVFSLIMSIVATITSAGALLGQSMEIYTSGLLFALYCSGPVISGFISASQYLPVFYKLGRNTVYEYLELRFCKEMRVGISVMQSSRMIMLSSSYIYGTALILDQVTNLDMWTSVGIIGSTCIVYTSLGGLKAVVWTDVMQQLIVFSILFLLIIKGLIDIGGFEIAWDNFVISGRNNILTSWVPDSSLQYSFWTLTIGSTTSYLRSHALNQSLMQRYLSSKSLTKAKVCLIGGSLGFAFYFGLMAACGVIATARYFDCDPLMVGLVKTRDQLLILFAVETLSLYKGLTGVFVAGLLCATISTLSSYLNSLAAVTMADYIRPFYPHMSAKNTLRISKLITVFHGLLCIAAVAVIQHLGGIMRIIFIMQSLTGGPTLMIFTVGMLLPWVTSKAAVIGALASMILPWWATIGHLMSHAETPHLPFSAKGCSNLTDVIYDDLNKSYLQEFYSISPVWYTSWSLSIGIIVSLIAGKIIGFQDSTKVDPDLLFPCIRRFFTVPKVIETTEYTLCDSKDKNFH